MQLIQRLEPTRSSIIIIVLILSYILLQTGQANAEEPGLADQVAALKLGMNGYIIGSKVTGEQKEKNTDNLSADSYAGTYKFRDRDIHIVAAADNDTILAIYQRDEEADKNLAKQMISNLMGHFGEPTTMAHDKLIYWAYTTSGKISEDTFNQLREKNETPEILATVKFNSTFEITGADNDQKLRGVNYFIISSDPLTRLFIDRAN